jgi:hypothetical protein
MVVSAQEVMAVAILLVGIQATAAAAMMVDFAGDV